MRIKRRKTPWGIEFEELEVSHDTPERRRGAGHSIQQDLEPTDLDGEIEEHTKALEMADFQVEQGMAFAEQEKAILKKLQELKGNKNESRSN